MGRMSQVYVSRSGTPVIVESQTTFGIGEDGTVIVRDLTSGDLFAVSASDFYDCEQYRNLTSAELMRACKVST